MQFNVYLYPIFGNLKHILYTSMYVSANIPLSGPLLLKVLYRTITTVANARLFGMDFENL